MKFGLKEKYLIAINVVLAKHAEVDKAILYGSRAKGNFRNGSDIDLTLVGEDISVKLLFKIATELDDLFIPNIIDLSVHRLIQAEDLLEHIDRVGVCFYTKQSQQKLLKKA